MILRANIIAENNKEVEMRKLFKNLFRHSKLIDRIKKSIIDNLESQVNAMNIQEDKIYDQYLY